MLSIARLGHFINVRCYFFFLFQRKVKNKNKKNKL